MHLRRLAAVIIGAWLAGSAWMVLVATHNLRGVDHLIKNRPAAAESYFSALGEAQARVLLRYQASELNRWYFVRWEWAQMALGAALLAVLYFRRGARWRVYAAAAMLAIVAIMRVYLTPRIILFGQGMDFGSPDAAAAASGRFWALHHTYSALEMLKLALGIAVAVGLLYREEARPSVRNRRDRVAAEASEQK